MLAAAIWEIGRQILASLLIGTRYTAAYGVLGSFIGLMLWCYYGVAVLLLGAEYIEVRWHSPEGGCKDPPKDDAPGGTPEDSNQTATQSTDVLHHVRTAAHLLAHPIQTLGQ
jgi:uncharacterized BrkB/YihY/UPF0761 family membrane protein